MVIWCNISSKSISDSYGIKYKYYIPCFTSNFYSIFNDLHLLKKKIKINIGNNPNNYTGFQVL